MLATLFKLNRTHALPLARGQVHLGNLALALSLEQGRRRNNTTIKDWGPIGPSCVWSRRLAAGLHELGSIASAATRRFARARPYFRLRQFGSSCLGVFHTQLV